MLYMYKSEKLSLEVDLPWQKKGPLLNVINMQLTKEGILKVSSTYYSI